MKEKQTLEKPMNLADIEVPVDPRAEWRQIFLDAYRFERDFFYDPGMHGVNWQAMKDRYMTLLDDAVSRWDVNWVIGEFLGELNASHTYHGGGDEEQGPKTSVGMLGVDWELANGAYRIKRIVRGGPWDASVRSPLDEPGVNVNEGDYVLAVNGGPLNPRADPWASFQSLGQKTVVLTRERDAVDGGRASGSGRVSGRRDRAALPGLDRRAAAARRQGDRRPDRLHLRAEHRHRRAERVDAAVHGAVEEGRARSSTSAGTAAGRFPIASSSCSTARSCRTGRCATRRAQQWPPVAHRGAQVMLINGWSGSGGDAFPFYFRQAGLGPLIGTRTWGGLIGISGAPELVDGGDVTVPTFRMYDPKGKWFAEGHGVDPDIAVDEDPSQLAKGTDPQLQRAIQEVMTRIDGSAEASAAAAVRKACPEWSLTGRAVRWSQHSSFLSLAAGRSGVAAGAGTSSREATASGLVRAADRTRSREWQSPNNCR